MLFISLYKFFRFRNGCQIATKQLRIAIEQLRNGCRMAIERL